MSKTVAINHLPQMNTKGVQVILVENELLCMQDWYFSRTCRGGEHHWSRLCDTVEATGDILEKCKAIRSWYLYKADVHFTINRCFCFLHSIKYNEIKALGIKIMD